MSPSTAPHSPAPRSRTALKAMIATPDGLAQLHDRDPRSLSNIEDTPDPTASVTSDCRAGLEDAIQSAPTTTRQRNMLRGT